MPKDKIKKDLETLDRLDATPPTREVVFENQIQGEGYNKAEEIGPALVRMQKQLASQIYAPKAKEKPSLSPQLRGYVATGIIIDEVETAPNPEPEGVRIAECCGTCIFYSPRSNVCFKGRCACPKVEHVDVKITDTCPKYTWNEEE